MKFSKNNNPKKKHARKPRMYSQKYVQERQNELCRLLADAKTEDERDILVKAFDVSARPY